MDKWLFPAFVGLHVVVMIIMLYAIIKTWLQLRGIRDSTRRN